MNRRFSHSKKWALAITAVVACLTGALAIDAEANYNVCYGWPVAWRSTLNLHRNSCSIAATGDQATAYWHGIFQWNDPTWVVDGTYVRPTDDCYLDHNDAMNEVAIVPYAELDGAEGLTVVSYNHTCIAGQKKSIVEADVMIAHILPLTPTSPFLDKRVIGREMFIHEFGHLFGMSHTNAMSVMRPVLPTAHTGGAEGSTNWTLDVKDMSNVYGLRTSLPNLIVSNTKVADGVNQYTNTKNYLDVCRGQEVNAFAFYIGNAGGSAATFEDRIRITASESAPGTVVFTGTWRLEAFEENVFSMRWSVPTSLPFGEYFVFIDVDPANQVVETREWDNTTFNFMRLRVIC